MADDSSSQQWLNEIFIVLRSNVGHDFSSYKENTLLRRINRRMSLLEILTYEKYLEFLEETPKEMQALFREFLIGVTSFYRDPEVFQFLQEQVLPPLVNSLAEGETFRVWVPACSTGEEVYSLGIILQEIIDRSPKRIHLKLFGTDIDHSAIDRAREGLFPPTIVSQMSPQRLQRFFEPEGHLYRIKQDIRHSVVFSVQDILRDPPFSHLHLLSCRNLLIYLQEDAQKKLFPLFYYTLKPSGILLLGSSESIGSFQNLFSTIEQSLKIFQRRETVVMSQSLQFPIGGFYSPKSSFLSSQNPENNIGKLVQETLLENICPTTLLVDSKGSILYVQGRTGKFLETVSSLPTNNILDMAREGLKFELATALRAAVSSGETVTCQHIPVHNDETIQLVNCSIIPLEKPPKLAGYFLVILGLVEPNIQVQREENSPEDLSLQQREARIQELEKELQNTRESHQTTIEELESSSEELQVTNEELQSSNEELQATNEELQSSKEELQSLNEELQSLNQELEHKINQLSATKDEVRNLLDITGVGTIVVDHQLRIKRFTSPVTEIINLIPTDIDRSLSDVSLNLQYNDFFDDLQDVLNHLVAKEKTIQTTAGKWYKIRFQPDRTQDNHIKGAVISFINIDEIKAKETQLQHLNLQLEQRQQIIQEVMETSTVPLILLDDNYQIILVNSALTEVVEYSSEFATAFVEQLEGPLNQGENFDPVPIVIKSSNQVSHLYWISGKIIRQVPNAPPYFLLTLRERPMNTE